MSTDYNRRCDRIDKRHWTAREIAAKVDTVGASAIVQEHFTGHSLSRQPTVTRPRLLCATLHSLIYTGRLQEAMDVCSIIAREKQL